MQVASDSLLVLAMSLSGASGWLDFIAFFWSFRVVDTRDFSVFGYRLCLLLKLFVILLDVLLQKLREWHSFDFVARDVTILGRQWKILVVRLASYLQLGDFLVCLLEFFLLAANRCIFLFDVDLQLENDIIFHFTSVAAQQMTQDTQCTKKFIFHFLPKKNFRLVPMKNRTSAEFGTKSIEDKFADIPNLKYTFTLRIRLNTFENSVDFCMG